MAFDIRSLKPGDEVGITWRSVSGQVEFVSRVETIEADGMIRVVGQELPFYPDDGREVELVINGVVAPSPNGLRLCEPTNEGRAASLREDILAKLDAMGETLSGIPLAKLREIDALMKSLLDDHQVPEAFETAGATDPQVYQDPVEWLPRLVRAMVIGLRGDDPSDGLDDETIRAELKEAIKSALESDGPFERVAPTGIATPNMAGIFREHLVRFGVDLADQRVQERWFVFLEQALVNALP